MSIPGTYIVIKGHGRIEILFGMLYRSTLMDLSYFDVCSGALLPDMMHDMLEGALQYELKLLLKYCLSCGFFCLSTVNEMIEGMEYGYMETSQPTPITTKSLSATDSNLLKQNGIISERAKRAGSVMLVFNRDFRYMYVYITLGLDITINGTYVTLGPLCACPRNHC